MVSFTTATLNKKMSRRLFRCAYCGRSDFLSKGGLAQHVQRNANCKAKELASLSGLGVRPETVDDFAVLTTVGRGKKRDDLLAVQRGECGSVGETLTTKVKNHALGSNYDSSDDNNFGTAWGEDSDEREDGLSGKEQSDGDAHGPNRTILSDFLEYEKRAVENFEDFCANEKNAIELMALLRKGKASLDTYQSMMQWHLRASNKLRRHEALANHPEYIGREVVINMLLDRYNLKNKVNIVKEITLPSSRARAKIIMNDAKMCLSSLLTDPRITDEDYLFFDDNPLSSPPTQQNLGLIGDINTGSAYRQTYQKLIKKPGEQVLLPVIFYIDGAATGQFADLPVTPLKFTLGIFNRKARERPHMWRTLGYLPKISKHTSRGRRQFVESRHLDALTAHPNMLEGEGDLVDTDVAPAQDMHTILATILEEFEKIQDRGFVWDLMYKGKVYHDIEFVVFVPFFKCDTEEADRLCGSYTSRAATVSQLCRYCCCPTMKSDDPRAVYPRKTVAMISKLVENNDEDALKGLSQQNIDNALYSLRFGLHNDEGVHGACPMEMLHALKLGIFKYVRDMFFEQVGENSQLADGINALAVKYGELLSRQSDRDMPKTKFSNGIQKGKLMGSEYTGVLLIIAAILRSTSGSELLETKKSSTFCQDNGIDDWVMLVETLLMWEAWLKSDTMERKHVHRSKEKHLYIMYLIRKVGNRTKGMGWKIMKYHAIMHMSKDILHFGVPMNFDTGADESGHKPAKTAAKLTQKRKETFDHQVSTRLTEIHCLDLACAEISSNRRLWEYFYAQGSDKTEPLPPPRTKEPRIDGSKFQACLQADGRSYMWRVGDRDKTMIAVETCFCDFVGTLTNKVGQYIPDLVVCTRYFDKHNNLFRGDPHFTGQPWRDWVMIDWGDDGILPGKIWGFVDLRQLPHGNNVHCGGLYRIDPSIFAIVESADLVKDRAEANRSELFVPITKNVGRLRHGRVPELEFFLADVRAFDGQVVVVPDVGGPRNGYFMLRPRCKWREDFTRWLERKYETFENFDDEEDSTNDSDDGP